MACYTSKTPWPSSRLRRCTAKRGATACGEPAFSQNRSRPSPSSRKLVSRAAVSQRLRIGALSEMVKTTTRREDDDAPQVQCDQCRRWAYLDETDFRTPREARASGSFVCNICSSSADLARKLEATEVEATELRKVVMQLQEQVLQLTIQLRSNVDNGSEGETTTSKEGDPSHEPGISQSQPPDNTSAGTRADRETRQGEVMVTNAPVTPDVSVAPSTAPAVEQPHGAPAKVPDVEQPVPPAKGDSGVQCLHCSQTGGRETQSHSDSDAENGKGSGTPLSPSSSQQPHGKTHFSQHRASRSHTGPGDKWVFPAQSVDREVIIVGDGNVCAIATSVQKAIDLPKAVGCMYRKGSSPMGAAMESIERYDRKARPIQRRYVVHAGLTDVLKCQPEQVIRALDGGTGRSTRLLVCSIPDVNNQGEEVRAAVLLANAQLRKWCKRARHRFINLNKGWGATMWEKEGLRYSPQGVSFVAEKICEATQRFLGHRFRRGRTMAQKPQSSQDPKMPRKHRNSPAQPVDRTTQNDHNVNAPLLPRAQDLQPQYQVQYQAAPQCPQTIPWDRSPPTPPFPPVPLRFPNGYATIPRPQPPPPTQHLPLPQPWATPPHLTGPPSAGFDLFRLVGDFVRHHMAQQSVQ